MSPRGLLSVLVPALIITLAIAVSAQAPRATTSDSGSDPKVLTNQSVIEMAAAKLPEEIIIAKIQPRRRSSTCQLPRWLN